MRFAAERRVLGYRTRRINPNFMSPSIQIMGPKELCFLVVRPCVRARAEALSDRLAVDFYIIHRVTVT